MSPYPTGCSQHCNSGADCTEASQQCLIPPEAGNVRFLGADTEDLDPPMDWADKLFAAVLLVASAGGAVALISFTFGWSLEKFFTN